MKAATARNGPPLDIFPNEGRNVMGSIRQAALKNNARAKIPYELVRRPLRTSHQNNCRVQPQELFGCSYPAATAIIDIPPPSQRNTAAHLRCHHAQPVVPTFWG